jgi:primosomal protein N' (replication factor Y)
MAGKKDAPKKQQMQEEVGGHREQSGAVFAKVVVDAVLGGSGGHFTYLAPPECQWVGTRVVVPFGSREVDGFVLSLGFSPPPDLDPNLIKPIKRVTGDIIKPEFLELLPQICAQFKLRAIDVLRLFVPSVVRKDKVKAKKNGVRRIPQGIEKEDKSVILNEKQQFAVGAIMDSVNKGAANVFLLYGVTGSGKTEVYMNVIRQVLAAGRTALMLVPEIGLTPQVLSSFRARFGDMVAMLHSGLSVGERYDEWQRVNKGDAKIVIGARSAVFAPLVNLGVIIIDEEHDSSYQSESSPRYDTHGIAIMRGEYNECPVVMGSATPSVDIFFKTTTGGGLQHHNKYHILYLPKRVNDVPLPQIDIIDMTNEIRSGNGGIFSRAFLSALFETLRAGKSAMIFLNRRGYSQSVRCYQCGWVAKCENCDISMVYHKDTEQLKCHYCDARFTVPQKCPNCGCERLHFGIMGTQKLVAELEKMLRQEFAAGGADVGEAGAGVGVAGAGGTGVGAGAGVPPIFRMDADNTKTKGSLIEILDRFANTAPSILVGTQMIAKGHHFPNVDLVGVIDADTGLHIADYRANERTFALITQVAGRAGRESGAGRVFVQTYMPSHYVYKFVKEYDYDGFFKKEINTRMATKYPPFSQIVRVLVSGAVDEKIKSVLAQVMKRLRELPADDFIFLGAMKCPHGRLMNKFRYQILARIKPEKAAEVINYMDGIIKSVQSAPIARGMQIFMEINPSNLS